MDSPLFLFQIVWHASVQRVHRQVPLSQQVLRTRSDAGRIQRRHRTVSQQLRSFGFGTGNTLTV